MPKRVACAVETYRSERGERRDGVAVISVVSVIISPQRRGSYLQDGGEEAAVYPGELLLRHDGPHTVEESLVLISAAKLCGEERRKGSGKAPIRAWAGREGKPFLRPRRTWSCINLILMVSCGVVTKIASMVPAPSPARNPLAWPRPYLSPPLASVSRPEKNSKELNRIAALGAAKYSMEESPR